MFLTDCISTCLYNEIDIRFHRISSVENSLTNFVSPLLILYDDRAEPVDQSRMRVAHIFSSHAVTSSEVHFNSVDFKGLWLIYEFIQKYDGRLAYLRKSGVCRHMLTLIVS